LETLVDAVTRVRKELREEGKSSVPLASAESSAGLAETILLSAARAEGVKIDTEVDGESVIGTVITGTYTSHPEE
jgi:hypothetical protein